MSDWMENRTQSWEQARCSSSNESATLQTIAIHIDLLRSYSQQSSDAPRSDVAEYLTHHKAAQEEWEGVVRTSTPTAELRIQYKTRVLKLTCGLASRIIAYLHEKNAQYYGTVVPPLHCAGDEVNDAEAMQYALTILGESLAVCCSSQSTVELQRYFLESGIVDQMVELYRVPRDVELARYGEGYRTCIMRVIANVTYENTAVTAHLHNNNFTPLILASTKLDRENAGLREWAEFAIRNITAHPPVVAYIKELKAQQVAPETEQDLAKSGLRVTGDLSCPKVRPVEKH